MTQTFHLCGVYSTLFSDVQCMTKKDNICFREKLSEAVSFDLSLPTFSFMSVFWFFFFRKNNVLGVLKVVFYLGFGTYLDLEKSI